MLSLLGSDLSSQITFATFMYEIEQNSAEQLKRHLVHDPFHFISSGVCAGDAEVLTLVSKDLSDDDVTTTYYFLSCAHAPGDEEKRVAEGNIWLHSSK